MLLARDIDGLPDRHHTPVPVGNGDFILRVYAARQQAGVVFHFFNVCAEMLDHAAEGVGPAVQQAPAAGLEALDPFEEHHGVEHDDAARYDLADRASGDLLVDDPVRGQESRPQRFAEEESLFPRQGDLLGALGVVHRKGLLADHMFAALQRSAAERVMRVVRHGDVDDVYLPVRKQLFRAAVSFFKAELFRKGLCLLQMGRRAGIEADLLVAELVENARHPGGDGTDAAKSDIHSLFLSIIRWDRGFPAHPPPIVCFCRNLP